MTIVDLRARIKRIRMGAVFVDPKTFESPRYQITSTQYDQAPNSTGLIKITHDKEIEEFLKYPYIGFTRNILIRTENRSLDNVD